MDAERRSPDFFDVLRPWSQVKHRILSKYLDAYLRVRGGKHAAIYFVDAFAGEGYYGEGDEQVPGSPIHVAQAAQRLIQQQHSCRLHGVFIEADQKRAAALRNSVGVYTDSTLSVLAGSFQEHRDQVLRSLGNAPAIVLLDPFGVKHVAFDEIVPVAHRRDTELMLNLNTSYLSRLSGFEEGSQPGAAAKLELISRALGEDPRDPEWIAITDGFGLVGSQWLEPAISRYCMRLQAASPEWKYVLPYAVRPRQGLSAKYYLVFSTRAIQAVVIMNDLVSAEDDSLFASDPRESHQTNMFDQISKSVRSQDVEIKLVGQVRDFGLESGRPTRDDIIRHFVVRQFGQFKQKHYRQALEVLLRQGAAERDDSNKNVKMDQRPITFRPTS